MQIQVTLVGSLRDKLPKQAKGMTTIIVDEGCTVADVLQQLQLATTIAAAVGGQQVDKAYLLKDGDALQLFRMLGGGWR